MKTVSKTSKTGVEPLDIRPADRRHAVAQRRRERRELDSCSLLQASLTAGEKRGWLDEMTVSHQSMSP